MARFSIRRCRFTFQVKSKNGHLFSGIVIVGAAKHLYLIFDYDNDEVLKAIKCPTLLLFAEFDINVDPKENIDHLNHIFEYKIPNNIAVITMPKGQHGFYKVENRCVP